MKKWFYTTAMITVLMLLLAGCGADSAASQSDQMQESSAAHAGQGSEEPAAAGTTETFTQGKLVLEVSHVNGVRTESRLAEGMEPYEETVFTCYPGAELTVINADMSDSAYSEDHKAHPQWGLYDRLTDTRTALTDTMEPILLDNTTDAVLNMEASIAVLLFEFTE